jgi:hypothetical protein
MGDTKECSKCGETKEVTAFSRDRTAPDGRDRWCKECKRLYDMGYTTGLRRGREGR